MITVWIRPMVCLGFNTCVRGGAITTAFRGEPRGFDWIQGRRARRRTQLRLSDPPVGRKPVGRGEMRLLIENQDPTRRQSGEVRTVSAIWFRHPAGGPGEPLRRRAIETALSEARKRVTRKG